MPTHRQTLYLLLGVIFAKLLTMQISEYFLNFQTIWLFLSKINIMWKNVLIYILAIIACIVFFFLYHFLGTILFGWRHGGGILPMALILLPCEAAIWKGITRFVKKKNTIYSEEEQEKNRLAKYYKSTEFKPKFQIGQKVIEKATGKQMSIEREVLYDGRYACFSNGITYEGDFYEYELDVLPVGKKQNTEYLKENDETFFHTAINEMMKNIDDCETKLTKSVGNLYAKLIFYDNIAEQLIKYTKEEAVNIYLKDKYPPPTLKEAKRRIIAKIHDVLNLYGVEPTDIQYIYEECFTIAMLATAVEIKKRKESY